ncbi:MAG: sigma-70 family RNA polymerase sigma factor [Gemmatimonadetes bacterium]|nr:sigma-70 family RNA polymerase sigma factor [Gemmatimonadota bacterium]
MKSVLGGDPAALRALMARYDRLVRYTIFQRAQQHCRKDPQWLDSVASATWAGFVQSLNSSPENPPSSVSAYVVRIARNQVARGLRKRELRHESLDALDIDAPRPLVGRDLELAVERSDFPLDRHVSARLLERPHRAPLHLDLRPSKVLFSHSAPRRVGG